jgi:transcription elongation factor GreB
MTDPIHHMTPKGHAALSKELHWLIHEERPRITEIVSWAAGNGDRSENGDYLYNKKRLREIDRRLRYLTKKLENTRIVDPREQQKLDRVYFGATVTYAREDNSEITVQLVDVDETDIPAPAGVQRINWFSPVGRALMKAQEGDMVKLRLEGRSETLEVLEISYPLD